MALYAIGDLHLCLGAEKPMDIFGGAWVGYMDKLKEGLSVIEPEDTTVLLGDLSWALSLEASRADFAFINEIPGNKIILKGNHDYWWCTAKKFGEFCQRNSFSDMQMLNNNHFEYDSIAICGTHCCASFCHIQSIFFVHINIFSLKLYFYLFLCRSQYTIVGIMSFNKFCKFNNRFFKCIPTAI